MNSHSITSAAPMSRDASIEKRPFDKTLQLMNEKVRLTQSQARELPGLGIKIGADVQLPFNVRLYYDGEVLSLFDHTEQVYRRFQPDFLRPDSALEKKLDQFVYRMRSKFGPFSNANEDMAHVHIYHEEIGRVPVTIYSIAKRFGLDRNMSIFADGHGSGKFLQDPNIRRPDVLQQALDAKGVGIDVLQYRDEDFADLAGFLALRIAKDNGDSSIRIPLFKTNRESREKMGLLFGLELPIVSASTEIAGSSESPSESDSIHF